MHMGVAPEERAPRMIMSTSILWRQMTAEDLPVVDAIAAVVHPSFPEDRAVFAERQALYPQGTRLLELDEVASGYILSHPWRFGVLPALNSLLGAIPQDADTYYLHDLALLDRARGTGAAAKIVGDILRHATAAGFRTASLVAVNGSVPFWYKHGFRRQNSPELAEKLASYEDAAAFMVKQLV
jgi:GNAT superfamily N-acetyltransferase